MAKEMEQMERMGTDVCANPLTSGLCLAGNSVLRSKQQAIREGEDHWNHWDHWEQLPVGASWMLMSGYCCRGKNLVMGGAPRRESGYLR